MMFKVFRVRLDKDTLPMQPIEIVPPRSGGTIPMGAPLRRAKKRGEGALRGAPNGP